MSSNHRQIIEEGNFQYSLLGKTFEKQIKAIEDQEKKQVRKKQRRELEKWELIKLKKKQMKLKNVKMKL